ncbi:MAG: hypothetical protein E7598_01990 [Ruminococcaceae bacterium]|nr:hypothetical protein [Oscillospiraceae bacterium]
MRKRNLFLSFIFVFLTAFCLTCGICAAGDTEYIVRLNDDFNLFQATDDKEIFVVNEETLDYLLNGGFVEWYEEDYEVFLMGTEEEYDDTLYSAKWDLEMINAQYAWDIACYGAGVKIGVIDSGVSYHEDLNDNVLAGFNYITDTEDVTDNIGHGTFVSGMIAAELNGIGVIGAAPRSNIIPLKCFDNGEKTTVSMICRAIYDAVDVYDCDIINMSLGVGSYSETFEKAINYAADKGVIIVGSVGNYGGTALYYPAAFEKVIGVGSVDDDMNLSSFSQKNESVFVVAPGRSVISTDNAGGYSSNSGTSFSAPLVSGIVATLISAKEDITLDEVKTILLETATDLGDKGYDTLYGYGLVDSIKCFERLLKDTQYFVAPLQMGDELKITVLNNTQTDFCGYLVVCSYVGKRMDNFDVVEISVKSKDKRELYSAVKGDYVKCFVWRSFGDISTISNIRERRG